MILFKPEHVKPILAGRKTQTCRTWDRPRVRVGGVYLAKTGFRKDDAFARVRVTGLCQARYGDISDVDVYREGYDTREKLAAVWRRIYGLSPDPDMMVWVVDFEVVEDLTCAPAVS